MKNIILFIFIVLLSTQIYAKKYDGRVIKTTGDTLECKIIFSDLSVYKSRGEILSKRILKIEINDEKLKLFPADIINYSIKLEGEWQTYWSIKISEKIYFFMKKIVDGKLTLFSCKTYNNFTYRYTNHFLFSKDIEPNNLYLRQGVFSNKRKILQYLDECESVKSKINNKEIKISNLHHWKIIAETYNEDC